MLCILRGSGAKKRPPNSEGESLVVAAGLFRIDGDMIHPRVVSNNNECESNRGFGGNRAAPFFEAISFSLWRSLTVFEAKNSVGFLLTGFRTESGFPFERHETPCFLGSNRNSESRQTFPHLPLCIRFCSTKKKKEPQVSASALLAASYSPPPGGSFLALSDCFFEFFRVENSQRGTEKPT